MSVWAGEPRRGASDLERKAEPVLGGAELPIRTSVRGIEGDIAAVLVASTKFREVKPPDFLICEEPGSLIKRSELFLSYDVDRQS